MMVKLKIESQADWYELIVELKKAGLLETANYNDLAVDEGSFPIEFPIDIEPLLKMAQSPIAKPFRKKISAGLVNRAIEVIAQQG